MIKNRLAVIVLNWNGIDDTRRCIQSLSRQSFTDFSIIVVDNGSNDNSIQQLDELRLKYLIVLKNDTNMGFAGGVNTGIKYAIEHDYQLVALINNDALADKHWLSELTRHANEYSIVTGLMLDAEGEYIDTSSEQYSIWGMAFPRDRNQPTISAYQSGETFGATGGATLYNVSLFKEIGLFDETFFAYFEDVDISYRSHLQGYKTYYTQSAVTYHDRGTSSKKIPGFTIYQMFKNLPLLFWKNTPKKLIFKIGIRFLLLYTMMFANAIKNGTGLPAIKGLIASVYYFWVSALWKRLHIQRTKKVSADYIWSVLYHDLPPEQTGMRKLRKLFTGKN